MEVSGQLHSSLALPTRKDPPLHNGGWMGSRADRSRRCEEDKYLLHLPGARPNTD
jgi:hypothetical protein